MARTRTFLLGLLLLPAAALAAGLTPIYPITAQLGIYDRLQKGQEGAPCQYFYVSSDFSLKEFRKAPVEMAYDDDHGHWLQASASNDAWRREAKKQQEESGQSFLWGALKAAGLDVVDAKALQLSPGGAPGHFQVVQQEVYDGKCTTEVVLLKDGVPMFAARNASKDCRKNAEAIVDLLTTVG